MYAKIHPILKRSAKNARAIVVCILLYNFISSIDQEIRILRYRCADNAP